MHGRDEAMGPDADDASAGADYTRRDVLRIGAATAVGATLLSSVAIPAEAAGAKTAKPLDATLGLTKGAKVLTPQQQRTVEAIAERIIPTDGNGPGATEAMVWRYIDRALAGEYAVQKPLYDANLAAIDTYASTQHGGAFADLPADQQDAVLQAVSGGEATGFTPDSASFFGMVRQHVVEGMFGDPYHGGNANFAGWKLIDFAGILMATPAANQKIGAVAKGARKSVVQLGFNVKKVG
jgi:gluconate 2-dehydrogenase gamma chain